MAKGLLIGKGRTAEVYQWSEDKVLKLYYPIYPEEKIKYEAEIGKWVNGRGIPAPEVYDLIQEGDRQGIIFKQISGKSMLRLIETKPWKVYRYARQMARLHLEIHNYAIGTPFDGSDEKNDKFLSQKEQLADKIKQAAGLLQGREKIILNYLKKLPTGSTVCHGDFHPDNILVTEKGFVVIDWSNTSSGDALSDVARTWITLSTPFLPTGVTRTAVFLAKPLKKMLSTVYIKEYVRLGKFTLKEINNWLLPIAAARLHEKVPGEEGWLIEIIDRKLKKLEKV